MLVVIQSVTIDDYRHIIILTVELYFHLREWLGVSILWLPKAATHKPFPLILSGYRQRWRAGAASNNTAQEAAAEAAYVKVRLVSLAVQHQSKAFIGRVDSVLYIPGGLCWTRLVRADCFHIDDATKAVSFDMLLTCVRCAIMKRSLRPEWTDIIAGVGASSRGDAVQEGRLSSWPCLIRADGNILRVFTRWHATNWGSLTLDGSGPVAKQAYWWSCWINGYIEHFHISVVQRRLTGLRCAYFVDRMARLIDY